MVSKTSKKNIFEFKKREIGLFFLGIGLTMFILNITTYMQILPYISFMKQFTGVSPLTGYYTSISSSIILMIYSLYNIYKAEL